MRPVLTMWAALVCLTFHIMAWGGERPQEPAETDEMRKAKQEIRDLQEQGQTIPWELIDKARGPQYKVEPETGDGLVPVQKRQKLLERLQRTADNPLVYGNVEWPDEAQVEKKSIKDKALYKDEIERTWYWFRKIVGPDYLPAELKNNLILMPSMKHGDDWALLRYKLRGLRIQVIDGRSFTVLLKRETQKPNQAAEDYVISLFKELLFSSVYQKQKAPIKTENVTRDAVNGLFGSLTYDADKTERWITKSGIRWWSDGDCVVFDIEKIIEPPQSKGPLWPEGRLFVGGIPYTDERPFVRFSKDGAIDFVEEFKKRFPPVVPGGPPPQPAQKPQK